MRRLIIAGLALAAVQIALSLPEAHQASAAAPVFEDAPCPMPIPDGQRPEDVRCGFLTVPEFHANDNGRTLKLAVAVIKSTSPNPAPDPVVYLTGGPGAPALDGELQGLGQAGYGDFVQSTRDFIFFDQRGTGYSEPGLYCPETLDLTLENLVLGRTLEEAEANNDQKLLACRDRLLAEGVDLAAYNSAESAHDIAGLVNALGYDDYNLYGTSYGTRLALTAMREAPEHIRSVVLDSTVPVQIDLPAEIARDFERSLGEVFDGCRTQPSCQAAYPDLEGTWWDLINRSNANPIEITIKDRDDQPVDIKITGNDLQGGAFTSLYNASIIGLLPFASDDIAKGNTGILTLLAQELVFAFGGFADAMSTSVTCAEETPFITPSDVSAGNRGVRPEIIEAGIGISTLDELRRAREFCEAWGVPAASAEEATAVTSNIPALILGGQFDPITPPHFGALAGRTLSRSHFFQFPASGHGVIYEQHDCSASMVAEFLARPANEPDSSCIAAIAPLEFVVPEEDAGPSLPPPLPPPTGVIFAPDTGAGPDNAEAAGIAGVIAVLLGSGAFLCALGVSRVLVPPVGS
ncbi:MAG: alpha/beta fold hydrolase [Dehalococcoidia bacterium]